jgi:hypothetical protein
VTDEPVIPVRVESPVPIPVTVVGPIPIPVAAVSPDKRVQRQSEDPSLPATTTFQQDLVMAGQRNINLIWETTQGKIAVYVILGTMGIYALVLTLSLGFGRDLTTAQALVLGFVNGLATGVASFYFSRTNHTAIGGVGARHEGR